MGAVCGNFCSTKESVYHTIPDTESTRSRLEPTESNYLPLGTTDFFTQSSFETESTTGEIALQIAVKNKQYDVIEALLNQGASVNEQSKRNADTAMHIAARIGDIKILKILLNFGANPFLRNMNGLIALNVAKKHNHHNLVSELLNIKPPAPDMPPPKDAIDYIDYNVIFSTPELGLDTYHDKHEGSCIVRSCSSKTSKTFVDPSSIILSVNDLCVDGMSYDKVTDLLANTAKNPPTKIQFRVKMNKINTGYVKVEVMAGVQLKQNASYCTVQIGNNILRTHQVSSNEHPEWHKTLIFKNFKPQSQKKAIVAVYDYSIILEDTQIGVIKYELPTKFNKLQKDVLELKSSDGTISGVIILNTTIVKQSNVRKNNL